MPVLPVLVNNTPNGIILKQRIYSESITKLMRLRIKTLYICLTVIHKKWEVLENPGTFEQVV